MLESVLKKTYLANYKINPIQVAPREIIRLKTNAGIVQKSNFTSIEKNHKIAPLYRKLIVFKDPKKPVSSIQFTRVPLKNRAGSTKSKL